MNNIKIWFTSDTHFGQERTLKLSKRDYKTVEEMDEDMIARWNNKVGKDDIVFHLGDFGADYSLVKRLNGKIKLIYGNYEEDYIEKNFNGDKNKFDKYLLDLGFEEIKGYEGVYYFYETDKYEVFINMHHKPSDAKHNFEKGSRAINLFGHIHKLQMVKRYGLNVGVDAHNMEPIDLETVLFYDNAIKNHYDNEVFE